MANYFATSSNDLFLGSLTQSNTYFFQPGELSVFDIIVGNGNSAFTDTLSFSGSVNLPASAFGSLSGIERILFTGAGPNTLILPHAIVANSNAADGEFYVGGGAGDDLLDASDVFASESVILYAGPTGNDTLIGGNGGDILLGSRGDNLFNGGLGADSISSGPAPGVDIVEASAAELDGDSIGGIDDIHVTTGGAFAVEIRGLTEVHLSNGGNEIEANSLRATVHGGSAGDRITFRQITGFTHDFVLNGNGGSDTITGSSGNDSISGGNAADSLSGSSGNDTIVGGANTDILTGGSGNDLFRSVASGELVIEFLNGGSDTVTTSSATFTLAPNVEVLTYLGAADFTGRGNSVGNIITGKAGSDTIEGLGGNDTINGNAGADSLYGGLGNDKLRGLGHADWLEGNGGDDVIEGGHGLDTIHGGDRHDTISGGLHVDWLYGDAGHDSISGNEGNDTIDGGGGRDTIDGGSGIDTATHISSTRGVFVDLAAAVDTYIDIEIIHGSSYDDTISGDTGDNVLDGGIGNDTLLGLAGDDVLNGLDGDIDVYSPSSGDDTVIGGNLGEYVEYGGMPTPIVAVFDAQTLRTDVTGIDAGTDVIIGVFDIHGGEGNDTISLMPEAHGGGGDDWLEASVDTSFTVASIAEYYGDSGFDTVYYDTSGPFANPIVVNLANNTLNRGHAASDRYFLIEAVATTAGNDKLVGNDQNNRLSSGDNLDTLEGGLGNDTLDGGKLNDELDGGEGTDFADYSNSSAAVVIDLTAEFQDGGDAIGDSLTSIEGIIGSSFADTLDGSDGNDSLNGGAGADTMRGGLGNDRYYVESTADSVDETGGDGEDWVDSIIDYTLLDGFEYLLLTGTGDINGTGNGVDNFLYGNDGDNVLNGLAGADYMLGGYGNDTFYVNDASDIAMEFLDQGTDVIRSSRNVTLGSGIENLIIIGNLTADGIGNQANNSMTGNHLANVLDGLAGHDTINGGGGADIITFSTALNEATNIDTITSFVVADDTISLSAGVFAGLAAGPLAAGAFRIGAAAADANDRIIYNSATGALSFDTDGSGATVAVQFAALGTGLALTNLDFVVA